MKNWVIKKLGGYLKSEYDLAAIQNKKRLFRIGDLVYINGANFNPLVKYTLLEAYNCGWNWYVSTDPNCKQRSGLSNGAHIENIQFQPIDFCKCCNQVIIANNFNL